MKPWGRLDWLIGKLPPSDIRDTRVVGCLSAEERCVGAPGLLSSRASRIRLIDVVDPPNRYTAEIERKKADHSSRLSSAHGLQVEQTALLASDDEIAHSLEAIIGADQLINLCLDISCLPKRFFFLLIKLAVSDPRVSTLIVTYTQPSAGGYTEEHLAEDPEPSIPLPGFGPVTGEPERLIVGVGFEALGLPLLLDEYRDRKRQVVVLLPFPPGQPYSRRIWDTVRGIAHPGHGPSIHRVSAIDAFGVYGELVSIDGVATATIGSALAPYGPKPMSLGMCLYAIDRNCPVFYTQPRLYHPNYTLGIGATWGYCIKRDGAATWR